MRKLNKKGFTIVELVIVIAVIAILAAILVPTISKIIKKAHVTSDTQLVRNLNTSLAMDTQNPKHTNMQSALNAAAKNGFDVAKINAAALDNMILWDSVNDVFCYRMVDDDGNVSISYIPESVEAGKELDADSYKLWIISDQVHPNFSTYYTGTATTINTSKGFDAGTGTTIETINYTKSTAAQDVVIRTNSTKTTLNIDADTDTVQHYGLAGNVNVVSVDALNSYHENGSAAFIEVKNGRIALENGSDVTQIHLVATAGNFNNITVAKAANVEMPDFSRDPVEIPAGGKLVVALQEGTEKVTSSTHLEYVWLTAVGIYEQVTVSQSNSNAGTTYATSESVNAEKKETAKQIANNISAVIDGEKFTVKAVKDNGDWTYQLESENTDTTFTATSVTVNVTSETTTATVEVTSKTVTSEIENGLDETAKEEAKAEAVDEMAGEEIASDPNLSNYVARIGIKGYNSIQAAIDDAKNNDIVVVLKDVTLSSTEGLMVNKTITLNLNGKTITGNHDGFIVVGANAQTYAPAANNLTNTGHLTIRGNGTINNTNWDTMCVFPGAQLDIYDGTYIGVKYTAYINGGTLNIYGGNFTCTGTGTGYIVQLKSATGNIVGGNFTTTGTNGCYGVYVDKGSNLNLGAIGEAGPSFNTWRPCVGTNGSLTQNCLINIYSGTYLSSRNNTTIDDQAVIQLGNSTSFTQTLNVYGGRFEQTSGLENSCVFVVRYNGPIDITIAGGTFECGNSSSLFSAYGTSSSGYPSTDNVTLTVQNGAITQDQPLEVYELINKVFTHLTERDFVLTVD